MKEIPFQVSARTAKLIWKENFANANWAIIELVKNSYDADADDSFIIFWNWFLYIIDNWVWMEEQIIIDNWMKIWTDNKKLDYTTWSSRIKSWAKWIGRFALDRLCSVSEMYTTDKYTKTSLYWRVDWSSFDTSESIWNITAKLENLDNFNIKEYLLSEFKGNNQIIEKITNTTISNWTVLKLNYLSDIWISEDLDNLFNNLEILTPPFSNHTFSIYLYDWNNEWTYWKVNTANYDDFDYKIIAKYSWNKFYNLDVEITRDELNVDKIEKDYSDIFDIPQMKKEFFDLETLKNKTFSKKISLLDFKWFSNVDKNLLDKIWEFDFSFYFVKNRWTDNRDESDTTIYPYNDTNYATRTAWIKKFWWIRIFRDNFRVRPYWEMWDDWLQLWERQAQSPQWAWQRLWGYRIRPNQISWIINISRVYNTYFEDKSWREWIQENSEFELFRNIILQIIWIFEKDRNIIMNSLFQLAQKRNDVLRKKTKAEDAAKNVEEKTSNKDIWLHNLWPTEDEIALVEWNEILKKELEEKDKEIMMLRNLASVGLIISSFSHEFRNLMNSLVPRNNALKKIMKKYISENDLVWVEKRKNPFYVLEQFYEDDIRIKHWINFSLNSLKRDRRERKNENIIDYFTKFRELWITALEQKNITLVLDLPNDKEGYKIRCFEIDLDSIFNNLLSNSTNSLKYSENTDNKIILISLQKIDDFIIIKFRDNWKGLSMEFWDDPYEIFEAFSTSKIDKNWNKVWTWLWMYIVNSIIKEYSDASITIDKFHNEFSLSVKFRLS